MSMNLWLAYVAAVFVVSGTPGPNMLLSLTHGIHHGLTRTFSTMLGLLTGLAIILSISIGGLGAVLVASAKAFQVIKYIGAVYLIYLGVKVWRSAADTGIVTEGRLDALTSGHGPQAVPEHSDVKVVVRQSLPFLCAQAQFQENTINGSGCPLRQSLAATPGSAHGI